MLDDFVDELDDAIVGDRGSVGEGVVGATVLNGLEEAGGTGLEGGLNDGGRHCCGGSRWLLRDNEVLVVREKEYRSSKGIS